MNDCDVINAFVTYLWENGHSCLQVDRWPDKENRNLADIDAIAGAFAIEHTSIDTLPNQRRDSDWIHPSLNPARSNSWILLPTSSDNYSEYTASIEMLGEKKYDNKHSRANHLVRCFA